METPDARLPYQIVIGDRELASGTLAIRARDAQWWASEPSALADLANRCRPVDPPPP